MMPVAQTSTFTLDVYTIKQTPLFDNRHLAIFLIFLRDKLIGRQISYPCLSDCRWFELHQGVYANAAQSISLTWSSTERRSNGGCSARRSRGR